MPRWRARVLLIIGGTIAMVAGSIVPALPEYLGRDVLAGGLVLGGAAMILVAITGLGPGGNGGGD